MRMVVACLNVGSKRLPLVVPPCQEGTGVADLLNFRVSSATAS